MKYKLKSDDISLKLYFLLQNSFHSTRIHETDVGICKEYLCNYISIRVCVFSVLEGKTPNVDSRKIDMDFS